MPAGKSYVPAFNGWFVPDALMLDVLNHMSATAIFKTNAPAK